MRYNSLLYRGSGMKKIIVAVLLHVILFTIVHAAEFTCGSNGQNNSCTPSRLSSLVFSASDGDTINIASGSHAWNSSVTVNNKALVIKGAGIDNTIINCSADFISFTGSSAGGNVGRISHMTISGSAPFTFINVGSSYRWVVHNIKSTNRGSDTWVIHANSGSLGVVHSCQFYANGNNASVMMVKGNINWWNQTLSWGDANKVYVEGNTYYNTQCVAGKPFIDGDDGAKFVFRFNTITNMQGGMHGRDSSPIGGLQAEIYNNRHNNDVRTSPYCSLSQPFLIRGGTGYLFNNHFYMWQPVTYYGEPAAMQLACYRCRGIGDAPGQSYDENLGSPYPKGYKLSQQCGTGGPGPHTLVPLYEYNNTGSGNMPANIDFSSDSPTYIASGRDYYNDAQKPGYSQYTCPHPLAGSGTCNYSVAGTEGYSITGTTETIPAIPSNLKIIESR